MRRLGRSPGTHTINYYYLLSDSRTQPETIIELPARQKGSFFVPQIELITYFSN